MPLYSEHIANMYYSGAPTYSGASYGYSGAGSSLGSSYSAPYLNPGSSYSSHSSLGGYSRAPLTTRWITSSGRSYSPMLSTISERGTSSPVRINSPRRIPLMKRSYGTPTYTPRPININTADIDVSRDKYNYKRKSPSPVSPKTSPSKKPVEKEKISPPKENSETSIEIEESSGPFMPRVDGKPETGIDSSPGKQRSSTIKRGRTVVRLHTIKRKDKDSPRKPSDEENADTNDNSTKTEVVSSDQSDSMKWRDKLADDLIYNDKREKKSLGTKLAEKFLVKEKDDIEIIPRKWETQQSSENLPPTTSENREPSKLSDRRCSMELLAEQANLLDSLIKSENLSTATLDLSKVGVEEEPQKSLDTYPSIKRQKSNQKNPLKTTKSDNCLYDNLKLLRDQKQLSKRRSLKKSSSGGSICRLDSITELPKEPVATNLPAIEEIEKRLSVKHLEKAKPKLKPRTIPKITSSVEVSAPVSPLKFKIENVTVEEKTHVPKKEITYSSVVIEDDKIKEAEPEKEILQEAVFTFESRDKSAKPVKNIPSPEPEDGNFWDKIGKRETVYLLKRKQNLEEDKERNRRALFWFPEEDDEEGNNNMTMSYKPQDKNDSIYQEYSEIKTKETQSDQESNTKEKIIEEINEENIESKNLSDQSLDIKSSDTTKESPTKENKIDNVPTIVNKKDNLKPDIPISLEKEASINIKENVSTENITVESKTPEKQKESIIPVALIENNASESKNKTTNVKTSKNDSKPISIKQNKTEKDKPDESKILFTNENDTNMLDTNDEMKEKISLSSHSDNKSTIEVDKTPPDIFKDAIEDVTSSVELQTKPSKNITLDFKNKTTDKSKPIGINNKKSSPPNKQCVKSIKKNPENNSKNGLNVLVSKSNNIIESNSTTVNKPEKSNSDNIPVQININKVEMKNTGEKIKAEVNTQKEKEDVKPNKRSLSKDKEDKTVAKSDENDEKVEPIPEAPNKKEDQHVDQCSENKIAVVEKKEEVDGTNSKKEENLVGKEEELKIPSLKDVVKLPTAPVFKKPVKVEAAVRPLIATPRPLQKKAPQIIHSSSSSETSSDEEDSSDEEEDEESDSSEGSTEFFECENNTDGRTSTGSNDSGFDSSAPTSPAGFAQIKKDCDVNCHRKCEKLTANLCGVNQRLLVEALATRTSSKRGAESPGPSAGPAPAKDDTGDISERELEQSTAYGIFRKTGRFTPPARSIPRFRKYTVEDFQFIKVLGKGSFGKVLLAELKDTEYYYAVKCLKKDVVLEDDDVECTLIERKVLALGTNHPYLCHLFATFQTDSHLFFVMEYLNGGDLMFHIQQSGRFPEARARFYAAEIVSGLKFLHKRGIVYRDLKLDNILLDFDGHVRIADFGMCKLQIYLDKTADTFCGTPDYMAPEIIKGLKYNQTVDWWSFGVLLYEMLIGQSPFSGCDEDELFWSICNEMPSYPRFLSQQALTILTRLLDKDAMSRLGGVECMHGDVRDQDFFHSVHWERLERRDLDAPFKPTVRHPLDTQYFDRAFTGERPRLTAVEPHVLRSMDQGPFRGFSYTNPNATDR